MGFYFTFSFVMTKTIRYGLGIVAEEYVEGQMIDIEVELTAYHQVPDNRNTKKHQLAIPIPIKPTTRWQITNNIKPNLLLLLFLLIVVIVYWL